MTAAKTGEGLPLRRWQQGALDQYRQGWPRDFLVTATPGSGKTTFGLAAARELFDTGRVRRLVVVTPTDHLRTQWVRAGKAAGFDLRATPNNERLPSDADGVVATYAQVAAAPAVFNARCTTAPTVVLFDELHHAGARNSWGEGVLDAFELARHRVGITGTPFRSDSSCIPHVTYQPVPDADDPGAVESVADFTYGYGDALRDGVVRPVAFAAYSAATQWSPSAGRTRNVLLGDPSLGRRTEDEAWKSALSPDAEWIPHLFAAMDHRLTALREREIPDAAALVLASSQADARAYAEVWEQVNGYRPALILSDDPESSAEIGRFREDPSARAAISVRMVSEGVDIPRAAVLGFATRASTPLFFAQAVGRVVRSRRRGETATVFLPAVSRLLAMAAAMETERNHVLSQPPENSLDIPVADPEPPVTVPDPATAAGSAPAPRATAAFHTVIPGSTSQGELLPGLLTADQEAELLAKADAHARARAQEATRERARARTAQERRNADDRAAALRDAQRHGGLEDLVGGEHVTGQRIEQAPDEIADLRRLIAARVRSRARDTGAPIERVWGELYRTVPGPKNASASRGQLQDRLRATDGW